MYERNTEQKNNYFRELTLNLRYEGFAVGPEEDGLLPMNLEGQRLCLAVDAGGIRYWKKDVSSDSRSAALDKVTDIVKVTDEYMNQIETAPVLQVGSLDTNYRLLADFNGTVLAGHLTKYGTQFVTWSRSPDGTSLNQGNYYGPDCGIDGYAASKQNFAVRSGLVPNSALFSPEQLTEVYRSIHEALENIEPLTDERIKHLESASEQIKRSVPDLEKRVSLSSSRRTG